MTRHFPMPIFAALVAVLSLAFAPAASAQAVQVSADISPASVYVGMRAVLQIEIAGIDQNNPPTPPRAPVVPGLSIEYAGASLQTAPYVVINGRRQDTGPDRYILQYTVTPDRQGRFVIPEMPVTVGATTVRTSPLVLMVADPPEYDDIAMTATLDKPAVYEGEPVTVHVKLYFTSVASASLTAAVPAGFQFFPSVSPEESKADQIVELELNGQRIRTAVGRGTYKDKLWSTAAFSYILVPARAGEFEIPSPVATLNIKTGERTRGMGLIVEPVYERRVARADPLAVTVRPLPSEGRPADFTGLVGKFDLRTSTPNTDVHVGEPIELSMSISGPRPMELVVPPSLSAIPAFAPDFRVSPEGWSETTQNAGLARVRDFKTTIRAATQEIKEIPAVSFSYFDPERGQYRTASSQPIPINVRETRQVTVADAIGALGANGASAVAPRIERVPVTDAAPGATFAPIPHRLSSQHLLLTDELRSPIIAGAVALPPLAFAATTILAVRRRHTDPAAARRRAALRRALAAVPAAPTVEQAAGAVRTFLAHRFDLDTTTVTAHDARRLVSHADPRSAEDAARILLNADAARYTASPPPPPSAPELRDLLHRLHRATAS